MAKKSSLPVAPVAPKPPDAEQLRRVREHDWDKAVTAANVEYSNATLGAWNHYCAALRDDSTKPGDRLWGKTRDYDEKYDRERDAAVKRFNQVTEAAAKKLAN